MNDFVDLDSLKLNSGKPCLLGSHVTEELISSTTDRFFDAQIYHIGLDERSKFRYGEGDTFNPDSSPPQTDTNVDVSGLLDYGGLAALVRSGEGSWNSANRGSVGNGTKRHNLTNMTIGQIEGMQTLPRSHENYVFAVGAYQFTPGVLSRARQDAGLSPSDYFTPENQNRLFWGLVLRGSKRPALRDYLLGRSDDLQSAWVDLAREWAAVPLPSGRGYYDGDSAGNHANLDVNRVEVALKKARQEITAR